MSEPLENPIVLITSRDPISEKLHTSGTGFAIYQDQSGTYLLTCTHVVKELSGKPLVITANHIPAKVVYCDEINGFDLAVLHIDAALNKPPLQLSPVSQEGRSFKTQGFFLFGVNKVPLSKTLKGILGQSVTIFSSKLKANAGALELRFNDQNNLRSGFSGAPVIDEERGYVLGVISHLEDNGRKGLAISIEALEKIWSEMPPGLIIHKPSIDPRPPRRVADYTKLEHLLQAGRWEEADRETWAVMLKAADREREGSLSTTSIKIFPCTDLCTINHLWEKYSKRRFGFSIQKRIWELAGGQPGKSDQEVYKKFGQLVGWMVKEERLPDLENDENWLMNPNYTISINTPQQYEKWLQYSEHTFTLDAPKGHLPRLVGDLGLEALVQLFYRVKTCSVDCNI